MMSFDTLIHTEQALLSCLIRDNETFDSISIKPEDFHEPVHRTFYQNIAALLNEGKPADYISLATRLEARGELRTEQDRSYLGQVVQSCSTVANIQSYAVLVSDAARKRKIRELIGTLDDALNHNEPVEKINELADVGFSNLISPEGEGDYAHIGDAVIEAIEWEDADRQNVKTGLNELDRLTDGLGKSNLIILAARPSMGKTSLAMQIAEHAAKSEPVAIFSLEMSKRQLGQRFLKYHEQRLKSKALALGHGKELKLHVFDKSEVGLGYIRSKCRQVKRQHGLSMIVVDYLQLMQGKGENRNQEIGSISRGLKAIAKEFDVPVIALSQLSRKVEERTDKKPVMSDLRESGEIEQDADLVLFIYRDEMYDPDTQYPGIAQIICRKNRNGPTGEVNVTFDGPTTRFGNYSGPAILSVVGKNNKSRVFD